MSVQENGRKTSEKPLTLSPYEAIAGLLDGQTGSHQFMTEEGICVDIRHAVPHNGDGFTPNVHVSLKSRGGSELFFPQEDNFTIWEDGRSDVPVELRETFNFPPDATHEVRAAVCANWVVSEVRKVKAAAQQDEKRSG